MLVVEAVSRYASGTRFGSARVGKPAVAGHWACRMARRVPDGQLILGLRGSGDGEPMPTIEAPANANSRLELLAITTR